VFKKCHAQDLSKASCHAKLSHSKQLLKNSLVILALLGSLTKRYTEWSH